MHLKFISKTIITAASAIFSCIAPAIGHAQSAPPSRILALSDSQIAATSLDAIRDGLRQKGWSEASGLALDYHLIPYADGRITDTGQSRMQSLLDQRPTLVITFTTNMAMTVKRLLGSSPVPVVMAPVVSPIECGLVSSLLHPEQDVTGIDYTMQEPRRLHWVSKILPHVQHLLVPYNHNNCAANGIMTQLRLVAEKLNITLHTVDVRDLRDYQQAMDILPPFIQAVFLIPDHFLLDHGQQIIQSAQQRSLPVISPFSEHVAQGALFSYAFRRHELGLETARIIAQILSGTRARHIPIEQSEPVLTINLPSANALSIPIPQSILRQSVVVRTEGR